MINRRNERGSITIFTVTACMAMMMIILLVNIGIMNKNSNQKKELDEIIENYAFNENELDSIYEKTVEEQGYATINDVKSLINQATETLYPQNYIKPTTVNGVKISYGGYVKIGKSIIVNMALRIDNNIVDISDDINVRTTILKDFPIPMENMAYIAASYPVSNTKGHASEFCNCTVNKSGDFTISENGEKPYTSRMGNKYKWNIHSKRLIIFIIKNKIANGDSNPFWQFLAYTISLFSL